MKEKKLCEKCVYSDYDYWGKDDVRFLGCFCGKKTGEGEECAHFHAPERREYEFEIDGRKFVLTQTEWLSYEGLTQNMVIFVEVGEGKWQEIAHAGHCGRLLDEKEAEKQIRSMLGLIKTL